MRLWKGIAIGFIAALVVFAIGAWLYTGFGLAPVAAAADPIPFEEYFAHRALKAQVHKAADLRSPIDASEPNLAAGATIYKEHCAVCHGFPNHPETNIAKGMFPHPPQLFHGKGVTDDPVGETFWLAKNGIRLSGMPAFGKTLSETQLWQVAQLLATPTLPAAVKASLTP